MDSLILQREFSLVKWYLHFILLAMTESGTYALVQVCAGEASAVTGWLIVKYSVKHNLIIALLDKC